MGKKFVKTTFAILSFMMLLPTSVFAEDAGNMEAAFVGESVLEADQSASYSDADSTLPFEEEKNNPTDEKIPETEEQTPEKTDSENQNSDLDGFISGDASAEDEKKTIHVIIENGNTDTDNGTQITDPVIDSGDYSAGEYSGGGSSASSSGEKILHKPQVLLEDNNLSGQNLKAGSVTEMSLTFRNKSRSQNVFGLKISISADTKGIEFERNSFYVQRLTPGEAITLKQKVCGETVLLIGPLQKRELGNPYETVLVLVEQSHLLCQFQTKCAKNVPNNLVAVCCEEKKVSSLSVHGFDEGFHLLLCHKFGEGRFPASILMDCNVCKTFCTVTFRKLNELVDFLSRHCALSLCVNTADRTAVFKCALKYNELSIFYGPGNINQLHTETQVRFVGTETVHSLFPGHSLDRELYLNAEHLFEQVCQQSLIDIDNIIYINESKLHIDLGELRLTVGTQVLITETFYDLDITVIAGAHQKLLPRPHVALEHDGRQQEQRRGGEADVPAQLAPSGQILLHPPAAAAGPHRLTGQNIVGGDAVQLRQRGQHGEPRSRTSVRPTSIRKGTT